MHGERNPLQLLGSADNFGYILSLSSWRRRAVPSDMLYLMWNIDELSRVDRILLLWLIMARNLILNFEDAHVIFNFPRLLNSSFNSLWRLEMIILNLIWICTDPSDKICNKWEIYYGKKYLILYILENKNFNLS